MGMWDGKGEFPVSFRLQPLTDVHTNTEIDGVAATINPKYIWILISIASGILLIACINFTTLSIGRSAKRAKEIGVRKVVGGKRRQLIYQFLSESILLSFLSAILGFLILLLILPIFNNLAGANLQLSITQFPELVWYVVTLILLTGILAGAYPAFVMSGFNSASALKNNINLSGSNFFTKSLVTLQFILSIALGISTYIILQQLSFMQSKDLGFDKENVLVVDASGSDINRVYPLLKQELQNEKSIAGISASEMGMGAEQGFMRFFLEYNEKKGPVVAYPVDWNFLDVLGMQLISGRNFDPHFTIDSISSIIVNEAFLRDYNIPLADAIDTQITDIRPSGENSSRIIIGVIRDFNFGALSNAVEPQLFLQSTSLNAQKIYVRINPGNIPETLAMVSSKWDDLTSGLPFQYNFLDDSFNEFYKKEERWSGIAGSAGLISILLACLGLFGLAALSAVKRTKEIGIRKVLGASSTSVATLLSKEFIRLILIAILVATPIVWYFMNGWLEGYVYRISIHWWIFMGAGVIAMSIALVTVSFHAIKAGNANPVKSLRTE
jgi:putative ABC transport system permease protein